MAKKLDELKKWARENVTLISILPPNINLSVTTRLVDVLEDEVDEKYYLHSDKANQLIRMIGDEHVFNNKIVVDASVNDPKIKEVMNTITSRYDSGIQNHKSIGGVVIEQKIAVPVLTPDRLNKRQNGRRFKEDGEPMFTLTSQDRHGIAIREATKQGYAIAEQGDSVNVSYPTSKTRRGRVGKQVAQTLQAGEVNQGVVINPLKDKTDYGWHFEQAVYDSQGITRTVKANGGSGNIPKTIEGLRIRKLTPLECWRLQGFTDEQFYKAKDSGVSNSQLYKQAGNSVTVNVVDAIVKCL